MKNVIDKILIIGAIVLMLGGLAVFLYPTVSNYFAEKNQAEIIRLYEETVSELDEEQIAEELEKAQIYNENLSGDPVHDPFVEGSGYALPENYTEVLNINGDSVMGYIEIPKISVYLPIYHGTSDETLQKGVGHIQSTSLPIGGSSTHCVLTGHTGLPSAELFTRIDELEIGDIFYIYVLGETLTYKVYETKVILPEEIDELQITDDRDLVTLVTCTPYGVNTHRLLVKAERTEYEEYDSSTSNSDTDTGETLSRGTNYYAIGILIGLLIFAVLLTVILILHKTGVLKKFQKLLRGAGGRHEK